jgi:hypothetical protein
MQSYCTIVPITYEWVLVLPDKYFSGTKLSLIHKCMADLLDFSSAINRLNSHHYFFYSHILDDGVVLEYLIFQNTLQPLS